MYTFEEFEAAAKKAGLYDQFSEHDLKLAKNNADAGMSLLTAKQDYLSATTDDARALANAKAESIRRSHGGYTGGSAGAGYTAEAPKTPSSFTFSEAPSYTSTYENDIKEALDDYKSTKEFSYDKDNDSTFDAYKKAYTREGRRATEDTLAKASSMTGGLPSSYAVTAAAQQDNYYAGQLADKIPELEQRAYERHQAEKAEKLQKLSALLEIENRDYNRYLNERSQYNADKSFAYGQHIDDMNYADALEQRKQALDQLEYERLNEDEQKEYERRIYEDERKYNRTLNSYNMSLEEAKLAAAYGDYVPLQTMGIKPDLEALAAVENTGISMSDLFDRYDGYVIPSFEWDKYVNGDDKKNEELLSYGFTRTMSDAEANSIAATHGGYELEERYWQGLLAQGYTEEDLEVYGFTKIPDEPASDEELARKDFYDKTWGPIPSPRDEQLTVVL